MPKRMDLALTAQRVGLIAQKAGQTILRIYKTTNQVEVDYKSDQSPLTIADKAANELICSSLKSHFPNIPIISEENKEIPYSERRSKPMWWVVDPLDGTKEFIKRNGDFTVNIALVSHGRPVLGVVYMPTTALLYWGGPDIGAWREERGLPTTALKVSSVDLGAKGLKIVCSRSHLNEATQAFIDRFKEPEKVSRGSSLKFLMIAEGKAHLYPRLAPTMEWDTAAAQAVLEGAGGRVLQLPEKQDLSYNKENLRNPEFLAIGELPADQIDLL